jgi:hypothetical protein
MAKLNFPLFETHLRAFDFAALFTEVLGWNHAPGENCWQDDVAAGSRFSRRHLAELGGVVAVQIVVAEANGWPDEAQRHRIWKHIAREHAENLLIFTDACELASKSQWYWVRRDQHPETGRPRLTPRRHDYFRGQPVALFAAKLQAMVVELSELDASGRLPVLEAARRIQAALDVESTTRKFFKAYETQHQALLEHIEGIDNERDKRWYASVLLNRLMFVWFLQKKLFLDGGDGDYLRSKLRQSQQRGPNRFFAEFLNALFFEAFAKPVAERSAASRALTGQVPYLNGGLFLHHKLELDAQHQPRVGHSLKVADAAFEGIFALFASYSWHLDDTPGGDADEINPDVLGYIFEKYINQKAFGAYYTRPEITGYLAERSIHQLVLERIAQPALPELGLKALAFDSVADLLARMDARTALRLAQEVLPSITVLDPAAGSGAFLVAALKCLINLYAAIVGRAEMGASAELQTWLRQIQKDHASVAYWIKRRVVTDNLYGVDIMEEACEIAKLRLFLAMVSSVRRVEDLEPLPNIDFNIVPGNSLVGLMRVDEHEFDVRSRSSDMFRKSFRELLDDKHRKLAAYRNAADLLGKNTELRVLRDDIDAAMTDAVAVMNELVQVQFAECGIKFEEATWDEKSAKLGKPKKRAVGLADVAAQHPLHWGYVFDEIVQQRGGFDIVLANPPWEVFKPQAKEFFADHSELVSKNKMSIKEFEKEQAVLLQNPLVRQAWLAYESRFPHMSAYYRLAPEYRFQSAVVGGKKTGSDINLYKLFTERCFALLREGGHCGIVIPSSLYKDMGATGLRSMLFDHAQVDTLVSLSNEKFIFEEVHHSFGLLFLNFTKGGKTEKLRATFRINPREAIRAENFEAFVHDEANFVEISMASIRAMSAQTLSVLEFRNATEAAITQKMLHHPPLGEKLAGSWHVKFTTELHMTNDSHIFKTEPAPTRRALFEGKMINQFTADASLAKYWVDEAEAMDCISTKNPEKRTAFQSARLVLREIARSTDARTIIASVIPPGIFANHKLILVENDHLPAAAMMYLLGVFNSICFDFLARQRVTSSVSMFLLHQLPLPKPKITTAPLQAIAQRAAKLIFTTPAYDTLAHDVGLKNHQAGATDPAERAKLRAELDGLVAHLYGLSEAEFAHILGTFPLVPEPAKVAAHNAYRDIERGLIA